MHKDEEGKRIAMEMKERTSQLFKEDKPYEKSNLDTMKNYLPFFVILIAMACSTPKKLPDQPLGVETREIIPGFDKQGHRGARGLMPENTFPAMKTALDMGVTTLEMDIVLTKDKQAILSHEPFFNHEITTKPDGSHVTEDEETSH